MSCNWLHVRTLSPYFLLNPMLRPMQWVYTYSRHDRSIDVQISSLSESQCTMTPHAHVLPLLMYIRFSKSFSLGLSFLCTGKSNQNQARGLFSGKLPLFNFMPDFTEIFVTVQHRSAVLSKWNCFLEMPQGFLDKAVLVEKSELTWSSFFKTCNYQYSLIIYVNKLKFSFFSFWRLC